MNVIDHPNGVKVHLAEHEVRCKNEAFGRSEATALHPNSRCKRGILFPATGWKQAKSLQQPQVVESAVCDPGVQRIAEQVVDPVNAEGVPSDDLAEDRFPHVEVRSGLVRA